MAKYVIKGGNRLEGSVTINGAKNAALIAASIFALTDKALEQRLIAFRKAQTEKVLAAEL